MTLRSPINRLKQRSLNHPSRVGAVLVEFAVIAGLLFLLIFASIEFSRAMTLRQAADSAAYETARSLIVPGATAANGTVVANKLLKGASVRTFDIQITPSDITDDTSKVTVKVTVPIKDNSWSAPFFFRDSLLTSQITLLTERNPASLLKAAVPPLPPAIPIQSGQSTPSTAPSSVNSTSQPTAPTTPPPPPPAPPTI